MKKLVTSYTFDASAKTIVSADFTSLEKIQLITNVTDQVIVYNFADTDKGGSLSGTTLTLEYDTTSMDDTDKLQIFVEDGSAVQPVSASALPLPTDAATSANQTTLINHVDGIETLLGTIDADTGAIKTAVEAIQAAQLPDSHNVTIDNASLPVTGTFWQATQPISASSLPLPTGAATSANQTTGNTSLATIAGAVSGTEMQADIVGALPAGTNNIGDVDIVTVPADPFGANADAAATAGSTGTIQAKLRLMTSQLDSIKTAVETLDNAISGSEMQVDIVGALPAGTNAIGKLASNSGVDIGDVTLTAGTAAIGKLLPNDTDVTTHTNYARKYYTNAGAVTDGIIWSPAAGKRWHITTLKIQVSAACTVTLEDDLAGGDAVVDKYEFAANSGITLTFDKDYPLASAEDAADLLITTTAGNVYVLAVGYEI